MTIPLKSCNWEAWEESISLYQSNRDSKILDRLWMAVSEYVRGYPQLAFRQSDEDVASDFYLYIWERRETLFEKFNPTLGGFRNFLSLRLRSHYLNFLLKKRKSISRDRLSYSDKEELLREPFSLGNALGDKNVHSTTLDAFNDVSSKSSFFPDYENNSLNYLILKLYYLDFFTEDDFIRLKEFTGKKYTELLEGIDQLREEVSGKKRRRLRIDEKLGILYLDLLICQEQTISESSKGEITLKEEELSEKRRKALEDYNRINEFTSFKSIAQVLNIPETKVANTIVYQRKVMEKKLYGIE